MERFNGFDALHKAVHRSDLVFNLHEAQDLSLFPRDALLLLHNVDFVRKLLASISCPLVHLSSVFVQCSTRWPNVFESEADPLMYKTQWPFKSYCSSKLEAENLINEASVHSYIMRCVPAYGEGDNCSVLTDLIRSAGRGDVASIGDHDGVFQMAYAGNLAQGLWTAGLHLLSSAEHSVPRESTFVPDSQTSFSLRKRYIKEAILLADETPKKNLFPLLKPLLITGKRNVVEWHVPFVLAFYLYYVFALIAVALSPFISMPLWLQELPDPSYAYMYFHHWTFFNTKKSRLMLDYQPKTDFQDALNRCQSHYRRLQQKSIASYSWRAHF